MEKRSFGKLQLNRETLRNLTTGELERVVGGTDTQACPDTVANGTCAGSGESFCYPCIESATCGCTNFPGNPGCNGSADYCTAQNGGTCGSLREC